MTKTNTNTKTPTMETLMKEHGTVSGTIRYLHAQGLSRSEIAKVTGKRYQHVRNVLVTPVKKVQ